MSARFRVIFMGTPDFAVPSFSALHQAHDVICVYTQPPRPAGRGQQERLSPVARAARELGLMVRHPINFKTPETVADFSVLGADLAIVVAYGLILPEAILAAPRLGCLNIHASLLPRWRGAAPIHRALMAGDADTGISIMKMAKGLDTGPVLAMVQTSILPDDRTTSLHDRLAQMGADVMVATLGALGSLQAKDQPEMGITYAHKIDKSEARIDWSAPCDVVDRQIRALSPFPGAWCEMAGERVKLLHSRALPNLSGLAGQILEGQVLRGLIIACGTGALEVLQAQRPGKKASKIQDFLRGFILPDHVL